jgi:hypothetical protein
LIATLALGTLGFALIAVFYAGLTANLRARESLLPVLMFPIVVPILLASVRASGALVGADDLDLAARLATIARGFRPRLRCALYGDLPLRRGRVNAMTHSPRDGLGRCERRAPRRRAR